MIDPQPRADMSGPVRLVLFGAGALAREAVEVVRRMRMAGLDIECLGFLVDQPPSVTMLAGLPVTSDRSRFAGAEGLRFCIAVGEPGTKARIAERLMREGARFQTVLDPRVWVGATSTIEEGSILFGHSSVTVDSYVGRHVLINPGCTVAHDNHIEDFVTLSPNVALSGHVHCGEGSFLGTGASVRPRIHIGRGAYVGAGAVVVRDVDPETVVVGNPAKPLRRDRSPERTARR